MKIRAKIKDAGLKATPQRRLVYEIMQKLQHAPIDEVADEAQAVVPGINVSTVYRIMESFCEAGLLSKINHPNGKTYFDITTSEHHHIINEAGNVTDIEDAELTELIKERLKDKIGEGQIIEKISIQIITSEK